jgi:hypothetical protein
MFLMKLIAIPVLFLWPGLLLMRILTRGRGPAFFLLSFLFSIPVTALIAFSLAEFGFFSLPWLTASVFLLSSLLGLVPCGDDLSLSAFDRRFCLALVVVGLAAFAYYQPPFEYYFGGRDPGIYVINGIRIARTGTFCAEDPLIRRIPPEYRSLFFEKRNTIRYMGFQMDTPSASKITPNFFYLYPVWIAVFYLLFGVHGALYATTVLACCVLLVFGLFARTLLSKWDSLAAVILLATVTPFLWFSRFPNSELLASVLVFVAIFCFQLIQMRNKRTGQLQAGSIGNRIAVTNLTLGLIGATSLALSFWTRVDAILMAGPFVLAMVVRWISGEFRKTDWWIGAAYFALLALGLLHSQSTNPQYIQAAFLNLKFKLSSVVLTAVALAALVAGVAALGRRAKLMEQKWLSPALVTTLSGLLFYAYCVRPFYPAGNIGSPNAEAFLAIGWYFTQPVVLLAVLGLLLYARRIASLNWILFSGVLVYALLYFYRIRGHAEHFWMLRRYLMVIFPAVALFAALAARELAQKGFARFGPRSRRLRDGALLGLAVLLAVFFVWRDLPVRRHHEFAGSYRFIESLSKRMSGDDLLLIGAKEANDLHIVGPLLSYCFDRNVLLLLSPQPDLKLLEGLMHIWKGRVLFLGAGNTNLASAAFSLQPLEQIHFETPVFDEVYHQRPQAVLSKYFQIGLYRLTAAGGGDPYSVDVGGSDDGNITNFYLKETYRNTNYRWTNGKGHVFFPPTTHRIKSIVLRLNPGPWVPGMERVHVKVSINDLVLVDLPLRNGYNNYEVLMPEGIQKSISGVPLDLRIESKTWVPRRVLELPDYRRIGVIVDRVKINLQ